MKWDKNYTEAKFIEHATQDKQIWIAHFKELLYESDLDQKK